jgi:hypothetical protein
MCPVTGSFQNKLEHSSQNSGNFFTALPNLGFKEGQEFR